MQTGKTVLVVDDDSPNRKLLGKVLNIEGYKVFEAENGENALIIVRRENVDLIVLDIMMPGMDGYEVCDRIKTDQLTKDIPVIILTGKDMDEGLTKAAQKKANFYIVKPYDYKVLLAQIETMLKRNKEAV